MADSENGVEIYFCTPTHNFSSEMRVILVFARLEMVCEANRKSVLDDESINDFNLIETFIIWHLITIEMDNFIVPCTIQVHWYDGTNYLF